MIARQQARQEREELQFLQRTLGASEYAHFMWRMREPTPIAHSRGRWPFVRRENEPVLRLDFKKLKHARGK